MTNKNIEEKQEKIKNELSILELKEKKQAYKKSLNAGNFSKMVISFCLLFVSIYAIACLYVLYKTGYETYTLLKIIATIFGGELLLLLFKRIWSSEDSKIGTLIRNIKPTKDKQHSNNEELTELDTEIPEDIKSIVNNINNKLDDNEGAG